MESDSFAWESSFLMYSVGEPYFSKKIGGVSFMIRLIMIIRSVLNRSCLTIETYFLMELKVITYLLVLAKGAEEAGYLVF